MGLPELCPARTVIDVDAYPDDLIAQCSLNKGHDWGHEGVVYWDDPECNEDEQV